MHDPSVLALGVALAWLAGVRVYLTVLFLGLAGTFGWIALPEVLQGIASPWLIGLCALLALVEFVVDKIPGMDGGWDLLHTLVRIPAGAFLGAAFIGRDHRLGGQALLAGGAVALCSHLVKGLTRRLINTSPEPLSNWSASLAEDALCLAALALLAAHPLQGMSIAIGGSLLVALAAAWSFRATLRRGVRRTEATA
ncbi:MAG TPA: DUF4126 domain-containing protein [Xanthomonadaceae bacterium]|jgi:uncharacterized membrane protein